LRRYRWPGNVRELSIVIERAARRREREEIGVDELGLPTP
jgi:DNA-binding NtrC family response regulator